MAYYREAGGYYVDVGGSELIISGEIPVQQGEIDQIVEDGLVMADGTHLPADIIVYATGYRPMNEWVGTLISPAVERKIGRCWGLGSGAKGDPGPWEGELRNMWKPTAQEGLWFQGGNLMQARFHSLHLTLQLKARMEGLPTPVYRAGHGAGETVAADPQPEAANETATLHAAVKVISAPKRERLRGARGNAAPDDMIKTMESFSTEALRSAGKAEALEQDLFGTARRCRLHPIREEFLGGPRAEPCRASLVSPVSPPAAARSAAPPPISIAPALSSTRSWCRRADAVSSSRAAIGSCSIPATSRCAIMPCRIPADRGGR